MKKFFSLVAIILLATGVALGQSTSGDLVGIVKDASGAVLSTATVSVTSAATGISVIAKVNKSGEYRAANLLPGAYNVKVEAPGFSTVVIKGVPIDLN